MAALREAMPASTTDDVVRDHYRTEAAAHHLAPTSTMSDLTTRELEVEAIVACLSWALTDGGRGQQVLEVGCGNGYLLSEVRSRFPHVSLTGVDFSVDMVELARTRGLDRCRVAEGDVRRLAFDGAAFDVAISERCVINLLEEHDQEAALRELHRVVRPGGHLILIEAFTDGAANLNQARAELGLEPNAPPYHNRWMDKERVLELLSELFEAVPADGDGSLPPPNFLSTHYFVSRVLYPAVTRREVLYNTEFVKFFRTLAPQGNYSPIQLLFLRRPVPDG
ncbi:MAG: class I SAM-dependent methyltransferase [Acidimicrobiales bacterium]